MTAGGWVKLHRSFLTWEWYKDSNTKSVFLHLLLTANVEDKIVHGILVRRGETITSYRNLATSLALSERQARTAIAHLKSTGEVTSKIYPKWSLITVINYEKYQNVLKLSNNFDDLEKQGDKQADRQVTGNRQAERQANDKQSDNNIRNKDIKKKELNNLSTPARTRERETKEGNNDFIPPTLAEVQAYCRQRGSPVDPKVFFDYFSASEWIDTRGSPVKNWKQRIIAWEKSEKNKPLKPGTGSAEERRQKYQFTPTDFD